ncbi:PilZ domain-containing protein [Thiovibrio sp. JS02]
MRRIIRTMIQATVNDAIVSEAQNADDAMRLLEEGQYHLVLFTKESSNVKWLEFAQKRLALPDPQKTNFVLLSSSNKQDYFDRIRDYGINEHLIIPCHTNVLGELITRICNPFLMRTAKRYSSPNSVAFIEQGGNTYEAEVINISGGGFLCELDSPIHFNWAAPVMVTLEFEIEGSQVNIKGLYSILSRLVIVETNSDYTPRRIRLACRFVNVNQESKAQMDQVFSFIEKQEESLGNRD